jgi:hypothetical protein
LEVFKRKSSLLLVIVFALILFVSIIINVLFFTGTIENKLKKNRDIEFIDSPIRLPYDRVIFNDNNDSILLRKIKDNLRDKNDSILIRRDNNSLIIKKLIK